jgi:hypothetical protein
MLGHDLNAMRLGTPTLNEDEQRAQETGEGTYQWPREMDPTNPTGVERDSVPAHRGQSGVPGIETFVHLPSSS